MAVFIDPWSVVHGLGPLSDLDFRGVLSCTRTESYFAILKRVQSAPIAVDESKNSQYFHFRPKLTWPLSEVMAISPSSFIEISLGLSMGPDSNFTSQIKSPFDLKAMMRLVFEQMAKKLPSLSMVTPAAWTNCPGRWPFPPKNHNFSFIEFDVLNLPVPATDRTFPSKSTIQMQLLSKAISDR